MKRFHVIALVCAFGATGLLGACNRSAPAVAEPPGVDVTEIPGHDKLPQDDTPKESPRVLPAETYIRSYIALFGKLSPIDVQTAARGKDGSALFDTWNDYLASLGLPDYRVDIPRNAQTNTLMLATFERLAEALCNRAVERDLQQATAVADRVIFAFETPPVVIDEKAFAAPFDVLHRTFLGYPARLASASRTARFYKLYVDTVSAHEAVAGSRLKPREAGWSAVCTGLARHPEFQLY